MTNTEHTPGTWKIEGDRDSDTQELRIVQESTGSEIAVIYPTLGYARADIANAWLIAAAPELLGVLRDISLAMFEGGLRRSKGWLERIDRTITKATAA